MERIGVARAGRALTPLSSDDERAVLALPEGKPLAARITRSRSSRAHRLYFAAIAAAAKHWPAGAEPWPGRHDHEMLRAWLQCQIGRAERIDFPVVATAAVVVLIERIRGRGKYCFVREGKRDGEPVLSVFVPESIDYESMDEIQFMPVRSAVFDLIESVIGVKIEHLIEHADAA